MSQGIRSFVQRAPWARSYQVTFLDRGDLFGGDVGKLARIEWDDAPNADAGLTTLWKPTIGLAEEEAQLLMDELWFCGLRPTEGSGSAGAMAATEKHLRDMRRIAFARLEVGEP